MTFQFWFSWIPLFHFAMNSTSLTDCVSTPFREKLPAVHLQSTGRIHFQLLHLSYSSCSFRSHSFTIRISFLANIIWTGMEYCAWIRCPHWFTFFIWGFLCLWKDGWVNVLVFLLLGEETAITTSYLSTPPGWSWSNLCVSTERSKCQIISMPASYGTTHPSRKQWPQVISIQKYVSAIQKCREFTTSSTPKFQLEEVCGIVGTGHHLLHVLFQIKGRGIYVYTVGADLFIRSCT